MLPTTIIFCHGKESGPWGTKIRHLAKIAESYGCSVISRDDRDTMDPELRTERLIDTAASLAGTILLVGSSMGGYVTAKASAEIRPAGLFLMAPAVGLPGYADRQLEVVAGEMSIVHGWDDTIVPPGNVIDFAARHRAQLTMLPAGHTLVDDLAALSRVFASFLENCLAQGVAKPNLAQLLATF